MVLVGMRLALLWGFRYIAVQLVLPIKHSVGQLWSQTSRKHIYKWEISKVSCRSNNVLQSLQKCPHEEFHHWEDGLLSQKRNRSDCESFSLLDSKMTRKGINKKSRDEGQELPSVSQPPQTVLNPCKDVDVFCHLNHKVINEVRCYFYERIKICFWSII